MKTGALLLSGLFCLQCSSYAQNSSYPSKYSQRETVILNREVDGSTTIEINNSGVYLNGEQIATRAELNNRNLSKKIVVRNGTKGRNHSYEEYYNQDRETRSQTRAVLGVFTDARKSGDGAYIDRVSPNSAAFDAGLRAGDVILRVDSVDIYNAEELTSTIHRHKPEDRVTITYNRNGKERQTTAVLGGTPEQSYNYPDQMDPMPPMPPSFPFKEDLYNNDKPRLGVSVENAENGVRIRSVRPGSVAESAGLRQGDIVTYLNDTKVSTVEDIQELVNSARSGSRLKIEIDRNGKRITRTATFPQTDDSKDL